MNKASICSSAEDGRRAHEHSGIVATGEHGLVAAPLTDELLRGSYVSSSFALLTGGVRPTGFAGSPDDPDVTHTSAESAAPV